MRLSLIDKTTKPENRPTDEQIDAIIAAGRRMLRAACTAWGEYLLGISEKLDGFPVELHDSLDVDGALGYHDNDPDIGPYAKIGVAACLQASGGEWLTGPDGVAAVVLHEVAEILGDPLANAWCDQNWDVQWAQELCDAVQNVTYRVNVQTRAGGPLVAVDVPDFVYPEYFNPFGEGRLDHVGVVTEPFSIEHGWGIRRVHGTGEVEGVFPAGTPQRRVIEKTGSKSRLSVRGGHGAYTLL